MDIPIEEIRKEIPHDKYGLRKWLMGSLYITPGEEFCVKKETKSLEEGYDCFNASVKVTEILQRHGIESYVCAGPDEKGLWNIHYFVMTDKGHVINGDPLYKTVGANHTPRIKLSEEEIRQDHPYIALDGYVPIRYQKLTETTYLLSRVGTVHLLPPTSVFLESVLIENKNPVQACEVTAKFNENLLYKKLYSSGINPSKSPIDELKKEFQRLVADKTIRLTGRAYDLKLRHPRLLEPRTVNVSKVKPELKEEIENDMDVLVSLTERIPFATPLT